MGWLARLMSDDEPSESWKAEPNGRTCDQKGCTEECRGHNTTCDTHIACM